ncbi:MBOAT family O-acyltransferase [Rufibacter roseus]|uniref:MBOAT family O-acyltransferase n=1 Tax=Rufibacter roseus TaxID=1567108 RepID=A0ABW2DUA8_9BACT|nr:MBOAT family O-acyltransferase [Rufibacter roseus]
MLFNSIDFALFLPIVFLLYWFVTNKSIWWQNLLIVGASYLFYGWWDWRFLFLIFFSTLVDYGIGLALGNEAHAGKRKALLWVSVLVNLGLLGFFKYYNFFLENFVSAFTLLGRPISGDALHIVLPVGISFYTFQTLSYTIDVYRKKLAPTKDFVSFMAFVSFFPQLVAGPIERATHLLPQFHQPRKFQYRSAVDGMRQILWGLSKKVVVADNCAEFANLTFNHTSDYAGSTLWLGAVFFAFQIYCDFSGYSDIAIGTARLFGFDLMRNFAFPYFSRDVAEFWRRWHISLSTWFRDYLYIPLGGSRGGTMLNIRNIFIIFIVSGLWHGANWTFIVWGLLHALYFLPLLLLKRNRQHVGTVAEASFFPSAKEATQIIFTFGLVVLGWVFFRAHDMSHAVQYLTGMFSSSILAPIEIEAQITLPLLLILAVFISVEWCTKHKLHPLEKLEQKWKRPMRLTIYYMLAAAIFVLEGQPQAFIYFQF